MRLLSQQTLTHSTSSRLSRRQTDLKKQKALFSVVLLEISLGLKTAFRSFRQNVVESKIRHCLISDNKAFRLFSRSVKAMTGGISLYYIIFGYLLYKMVSIRQDQRHWSWSRYTLVMVLSWLWFSGTQL